MMIKLKLSIKHLLYFHLNLKNRINIITFIYKTWLFNSERSNLSGSYDL